MDAEQHKSVNPRILRDDHYAWSDGKSGTHLEPFEDFDYDAIDGIAPTDELTSRAAEAFAAIVKYCWEGTSPNGDMKAAFWRFVVISRAIQPQIFNGCSYPELADRMGCTKQHVSKILKRFAEEFGAHLRGRSDTACANMSTARLQQRDAAGKVLGRK